MNDIPEPNPGTELPPGEPLNDLNDLLPPDEVETDEQPDDPGQRAWLTPVLAIVMLVVGLFLGYMGRPFVQPLLAGSAGATQQAGTEQAGTQQAELPSVNPTLAPGEPTPTLMEFLVSNTQHFKGDANAPVTMIEFSDYQ